MEIYTVILEYKGGTYVAQVEAPSFEEAQVKWLYHLEGEGIRDVDAKVIAQLKTDMQEMGFGLLDGLKNVYCRSFVIFRKFALVHFIKTDVSE